MQLITLLSAAATVATVSARNAIELNKTWKKGDRHARIINRCDYPVNIWSVLKGDGCPNSEMVTLKKGEVYGEKMTKSSETGNRRGVSIKISKTEQCKGNDITQLEYFIDDDNEDQAFRMNYLDVSYVDCAHDCPTKQEGYYLQAGNSAARAKKTTTDNSWCPILSCSDSASCAKLSYILPDDIATKTCGLEDSMDFYMCGSQAPDGDDETPAKPAKSSTPEPATTLKPVASSANLKVNIAAVTNAPEIKDTKPPKVKTKVVYVTAYDYVNAKRHEHAHAHAHARRHQPFNA